MKIIGHRGARGLATENTLASIKAALAAGVDGVEVDVRLTKDGAPLLQHDRFLRGHDHKRIWSMRISRRTLAELRAVRPDLITLDQAVKAVDRKVQLHIEVKPRIDITPVVNMIKEFLDKGWHADDFMLLSFNQRTLRKLHKALPKIPVTVNSRFSGVNASWRARQLRTKYVNLSHKVLWWGFIRSMAKSGYVLGTFALNDVKKAKAWERHGLALVITDYPNRFAKKNSK